MDYYDRDGAVIDRERWSRLFSPDYQRVALTAITDAADVSKTFEVSTVWLGIDHAWNGGPPVIFETMVFGGDGSADDDCRRYCTEDEAKQGHAASVLTVAASLTDPIVTDA